MHKNDSIASGNEQVALRFALGRYRLRFEGSHSGGTDKYLGSAWRGLFGLALNRLVCVTKCERCEPCMLYRSCVYPYVFETPPPPEAVKHRDYPAVPHPFVLDLPFGEAERDGTRSVGLTLIGRADMFVAYAVHAFRMAGEQGLRSVTGPLALVDVEQEEEPGSGRWAGILEGESLKPMRSRVPPVPQCPNGAVVHFSTPLRLRILDEYVSADRFRFSHLFSNLLRRLSLLTYFHTDCPLETSFGDLVERSKLIETPNSNLKWRDWTRYSSRQRKHLQMGGLTGSITLEGDHAPFWPYLWVGQFVHTGKGTSMGLGRYDIQSGR